MLIYQRRLWTELEPIRQQREHRVFQKLLQMVPGLEERIMSRNDGEVIEVSEYVS